MNPSPAPGFDIGEYHVAPPSRLSIGPDGPNHRREQIPEPLGELAAHPGEAVQRRQIIEGVWHAAPDADRTLTRCVSRLRLYLRESGTTAHYIETVPSEGYRLVGDVRASRSSASACNSGRVNRFWSFLLELRQRKVCRAALVYAVVVWLVYQVSEVTFPALGLPPWMLAAVVLLGILGFPVALVLAWTFEVTPQGVRVDTLRGSGDSSFPPRRDLLVNLVLIAMAAVLSGQLLFASFDELDIAASGSSKLDIKTLALAPFTQADTSTETAMLGKGLVAELRHRLRSEHGLRLVSLDSLEALGSEVPVEVQGLLLGSLRLDDETVQLTVYLVDRATGYDIWSGVFDQPREPMASLAGRLAGTITAAIPLQAAPIDMETTVASVSQTTPPPIPSN